MRNRFICSLVLILIVAILGHTSVAKANSTLVKQQQLINEKNQPINVEVLNSEELIRVTNLENENQEIKGFKNQLNRQGFKEIELSDDDSKLKYSLKSDSTIQTYIVTRAYTNNKENKFVVTQTIINGTDHEVEKFLAEKANSYDSDSKELLLNYQNTESHNPSQDSLSTKAAGGMFLWNGKSFVCSAVGLFACGQYCGIWAIVNPIIGGGCSVVCGLAFAATCAF